MKLIKCQECSKTRTDEPDYNPFALISGALIGGALDPGWYSGDDAELCGPCLVAMMRKANER